jgi:hypothetical protein
VHFGRVLSAEIRRRRSTFSGSGLCNSLRGNRLRWRHIVDSDGTPTRRLTSWEQRVSRARSKPSAARTRAAVSPASSLRAVFHVRMPHISW